MLGGIGIIIEPIGEFPENEPAPDGHRTKQHQGIRAALNTVRQTAVVPYAAGQMYALVNDIESYPRFLPWCSDARVLTPGERELTATLTLAAAGIRQSITTANRMDPGRRIDVRLLQGPFRKLEGSWMFEGLPDGRCRVELEMRFEFKSRLAELALHKPFNHIFHSMVDAFIRRAEQVHGQR
ncbi:MAG TPA: type II toxin-antitoxin system RatA family toxin [Gammaproteobacteria bacterium]